MLGKIRKEVIRKRMKYDLSVKIAAFYIGVPISALAGRPH